ncbi:MAG: hypothetical protein ACM4AI_10530 [Acidobacteriota bacterium]
MTQVSNAQVTAVRRAAVVLLVVWLIAAIVAGATGLVTEPGRPPLILLTFIVVPIALAVVAYRVSASLRAWTDRFNLTWLVGLHVWRFVGFGFILAWALGRLPAGFAFPEGLGDVAAAAGALALVPSLRRGTTSRAWLFAWNTFGLIDLVSALTMGVLYSNAPLGVLGRGGVTTELMVTFPVSLIPTFLVPVFILLHLLTFVRLARRPWMMGSGDGLAAASAIHAH